MLSRKIKGIFGALAILIGLSYPFIVYFGTLNFSPKFVIFSLVSLLALRLFLMRKSLPSHNRLVWPSLLALCFVVIGALLHGAVAVKLYPVVMSVLLGVAFGWSVYRPPTFIEMIARITEPDLDEKGVLYTRKVTFVWIAFFLGNAGVALWTALLGTIEQWTLYNGFISYCLIGLLVGGEYLVRRIVRRNEERFDLQ